MSFSAIRVAIESHIASNWTQTPVQYENVDLDTKDMSEYISINVLSGESVQSSIGESGQYLTSGSLVIMIFTGIGSGSARAKTLADTLAGLFRGAKIGGVSFKVPSGNQVASTGSYYQFNLTVPFYSFFDM